MSGPGIVLENDKILKIWDWTQNDIKRLFSVFSKTEPENPTNGFAIFLVCVMDIWGSIFRDQFGDEDYGHCNNNIKVILERLYAYKAANYPDFSSGIPSSIVKTLRHNLVHQYGLSHYKTGFDADHLNIDFDGDQPAINQQASNNRWHIDCGKLKDDLLAVIEEWLKSKGLI